LEDRQKLENGKEGRGYGDFLKTEGEKGAFEDQ
jgi:hypothetical protein